MHVRRELRIIGLAERVDFPDWGIQSLRAKVDTGARTSALHVEDVRALRGGRVRFEVRLRRSDPLARVTADANVSRRAEVRSTSGAVEERVFVKVRVRLGGALRTIEVGLVDRDDMIYRMLLGRSALEGRYLVDVTKRYALSPLSAAAPRPKFVR